MADINRIHEILQKAGSFQFLTVDGGMPKGRPFGFSMIYDGKLVFCTGTHKNVYRQMKANPHVEILATIHDDFLRYDGEVEFIEDPEVEKKAREAAPFLGMIYNENTGLKMSLFHLINGHAEIRSMMGELKETL